VASKATPATVSVRLRCILSGFEGSPGPGSVVRVDAGEAQRLIALGVAEKADA
jgi:hypothetical protein